MDNRTGIFVLQHPREHAHPIGTARFVELGLKRSQVFVAESPRRDLHAPLTLPPRTGLLFPRADSRDLEELEPAERPEHLVVLDGTWPQARTLYRRNPWLRALPHYRLSPDAPSRYRIRKEPSPDYVSTLESVLLALHALEPDTAGLHGLLSAFDAMVDTQIRLIEEARRTGAGWQHVPKKTRRRFVGLPRWLGEEFDDTIGVYAEALPIRDDSPLGPRELLQLAAIRLATGERYERMVLPPSGVPAADDLARVELVPADFGDAIPPTELAEDFAAFVQGRRTIAWNGTTPSLMHDATGLAHRMALLRPVVRNLEGEVAPVDTSARLPFRGRAGQCLADLRHHALWAREVTEKRTSPG